jgi:membrane-associated protein
VLASASTWFQHHLLLLHGPLIYVVVGVLVFAEVAIMIGFFLPGEIAAIVGGVIASQYRASLAAMVVVVVAAATLGNLCGYQLGKLIGPWLLSHRPLEGNPGVERVRGLMDRRGAWAVVLGRWIALVRAVLPGVAGVSGMDLGVFSLFSFVGGATWGAMWVLLGYAAGRSYVKIVNAAGEWSLVGLGVVVVAVASTLVWRHLRRQRA